MIYYIGNREMDMVKIGYSRDEYTIKTRIKQIQTYCPFHVEVIKIVPGNFDDEQALHKKFSKFKTNHKNERNEWFVLSEIEKNEVSIDLDEARTSLYKNLLYLRQLQPELFSFFYIIQDMIQVDFDYWINASDKNSDKLEVIKINSYMINSLIDNLYELSSTATRSDKNLPELSLHQLSSKYFRAISNTKSDIQDFVYEAIRKDENECEENICCLCESKEKNQDQLTVSQAIESVGMN